MAVYLLWMALFTAVVLPVCATVGGVVTWWITRGEAVEDETLLRHFIVVTVLFMVLTLPIPRTDWFRNRWDPVRVAQNELAKNRVHEGLREFLKYEWDKIETQAERAVHAHVPVAEIAARARLQQLPLVQHYLAFTPGTTRLRYGRALLPALRELRSTDPVACVELVWGARTATFDARRHLGADVADRWEQAAVYVFKTADMDHGAASRWAVRDAEASAPVDVALVQALYAQLHEQLQARHGDILRRQRSEGTTAQEAPQACAASIDLLTRVLEQEPAVAASLLRTVLAR